MDSIQKVRSITLWIFIVPFVAINACLILITQFHGLFHPEDIIHNTLPYIDGGASISRTARVFPTYLIFKPAMFLTSYLLIKYWIYNKNIILSLEKNNKNLSKIIFFGIEIRDLIIFSITSIKPCIIPQRTNFQFAPCHNPPSIIVIDKFMYVRINPFLLPPNEMYK